MINAWFKSGKFLQARTNLVRIQKRTCLHPYIIFANENLNYLECTNQHQIKSESNLGDA